MNKGVFVLQHEKHRFNRDISGYKKGSGLKYTKPLSYTSPYIKISGVSTPHHTNKVDDTVTSVGNNTNMKVKKDKELPLLGAKAKPSPLLKTAHEFSFALANSTPKETSFKLGKGFKIF